MIPTVVDLFSGAGGLSLGLGQAGFNVVLGVDSWKLAIDSYSKNFLHDAWCTDIAKLTGVDIVKRIGLGPGEIDLVVGGPPCQGFSVQRVGSDLDARNDLAVQFAYLVSQLQPRYFLMENVPGLLGARGKTVLAEVRRELTRGGFSLQVVRANAQDFGVPQSRRRIFLLGCRFFEPELIISSAARDAPTVWQTIGDLPKPTTYADRFHPDPLHIESRLSHLNRARLALIPPGGGFEDLPKDMRVKAHASGASLIGHRGVYGRLHPDRPAGTITARFDSFTRGRFAHPYEDRNITLREGARLQTFPDNFTFSGNREDIAALIGNAVPPQLAEELGKQLLVQISRSI